MIRNLISYDFTRFTRLPQHSRKLRPASVAERLRQLARAALRVAQLVGVVYRLEEASAYVGMP